MVRFDRCAGSLLLFLAVMLTGASPASAGKTLLKKQPQGVPPKGGAVDPGTPPPASPGVKPDVALPTGGALEPAPPPATPPPAAGPAPVGKVFKPDAVAPKDGMVLDPGPKPPAPPPQVKGWPHSILTATATNCARNPGPHEVIVYRDPGFGGSCAALAPGFYPYPANFLIGNDAISSIKVGSKVRARVFKDPVYAGDWNAYAPGTMAGGLGGFDNKISAIRVEPADRSQICDDLRDGEIALFENAYRRGDCVVLPGDESYSSAESMGIENDSISSMHNNSARRLNAFWHPSFNQGGIEVPPHSKMDTLPQGGWFTNGIDDDISSIQMLP